MSIRTDMSARGIRAPMFFPINAAITGSRLTQWNK